MGMDQEHFKFTVIIGHQGPLLHQIKIGRAANTVFKWNGRLGEIALEPLSAIAAADPVTCAAYPKEHDLLAVEGLHRFRNLAKKD